MKNRYKATNFSDAPAVPVDDTSFSGIEISDSIYDAHRNISHAFVPETLPDGTSLMRVVSDVELCMSASPEIRSVVSSEYQQRLREGLLNQPRQSPRTGHVSDDDLIDHVIPQGLEHDESAVLAKMALDSIRPSEPPSSSESPASSKPLVSSDSPGSSEL